MKEQHIQEMLKSIDRDDLRKLYSTNELQDRQVPRVLNDPQFNILFGEYGVIFPLIETLKENLGAISTGNILLSILARNTPQFQVWLDQQCERYQEESVNIKTLHAVVWNSQITIITEFTYSLFGEQMDRVSTSEKLMIEHMMSSNNANVVNETKKLVKEIFQRCIARLQLQPNINASITYLRDYMSNVTSESDRYLLEKFIQAAKYGQFGQYVKTVFNEKLLLENKSIFADEYFRQLQNDLFQGALYFQQEFDAGKFGSVVHNYPSINNTEKPNFKLINELLNDLRKLDQVKDLSLESSKGLSTGR